MKVVNRDDLDLDFSASFGSAAIHTEHLEGYSIAIKWPIAVTGTLKLQVSNDAFNGNVNNDEKSDAIWCDLPGSTTTMDGATTEKYIWNVSDAYYKAVRYVFTRTAGSGSGRAHIHAKGHI